jgi:transcriptional regulator with XRE-family HTH domain
MTTLEEWAMKRPVNRDVVNAHKERMREEMRATKLRELREALNLSQIDLASLLHVSQNSVSKLERGDIERAKIETIRRYIEAIGGALRIEVEVGEERIQIA